MSHLREINLHSVVQGGSLACLIRGVHLGVAIPQLLTAEEQEPGSSSSRLVCFCPLCILEKGTLSLRYSSSKCWKVVIID